MGVMVVGMLLCSELGFGHVQLRRYGCTMLVLYIWILVLVDNVEMIEK